MVVNKKLILAFTLILVIVVSVGVYYVLNQQEPLPPQIITNFEECAQAGYPVGESYPRQCWTPDGGHFIEELLIDGIKNKYEAQWMAINGVAGVGIGECEGEPCIMVYLENDSEELKRQIPLSVDGFKVRTEFTGPIEAFPGTPKPGVITVSGEMICLPKIGQGAQTMECAMGLKGIGGRQYGLKNLFKFDPEYKFSVSGLRVEVSGTFSPEEIRGPDGNRYDVVGVIDVTSIKEIRDLKVQSEKIENLLE